MIFYNLVYFTDYYIYMYIYYNGGERSSQEVDVPDYSVDIWMFMCVCVILSRRISYFISIDQPQT